MRSLKSYDSFVYEIIKFIKERINEGYFIILLPFGTNDDYVEENDINIYNDIIKILGNDKSKSLNFRLNINNLFDEVYIADGRSNVFTGMSRSEFASGSAGDAAYTTYFVQGNYKGVHKSNQVFFGFGRTWNFTLRYNF